MQNKLATTPTAAWPIYSQPCVVDQQLLHQLGEKRRLLSGLLLVMHNLACCGKRHPEQLSANARPGRCTPDPYPGFLAVQSSVTCLSCQQPRIEGGDQEERLL